MNTLADLITTIAEALARLNIMLYAIMIILIVIVCYLHSIRKRLKRY